MCKERGEDEWHIRSVNGRRQGQLVTEAHGNLTCRVSLNVPSVMLRCCAARSARTAVTRAENRLSKSATRFDIVKKYLVNEAVFGIKALPLIFAKEGYLA